MVNLPTEQPSAPSSQQVRPVQSPPGLPPQGQALANQDAEHLKILSVCHYVMSGLMLVAALFFALYMVMGGMMMSGVFSGGGHSTAHSLLELQIMGWMFFFIGVVGVLLLVALVVLEFMVAGKLVRRESKLMCMVVAGINCLNMPLGTVLGVFTFIVLSRPSVAESFAANERR